MRRVGCDYAAVWEEFVICLYKKMGLKSFDFLNFIFWVVNFFRNNIVCINFLIVLKVSYFNYYQKKYNGLLLATKTGPVKIL